MSQTPLRLAPLVLLLLLPATPARAEPVEELVKEAVEEAERVATQRLCVSTDPPGISSTSCVIYLVITLAKPHVDDAQTIVCGVHHVPPACERELFPIHPNEVGDRVLDVVFWVCPREGERRCDLVAPP